MKQILVLFSFLTATLAAQEFVVFVDLPTPSNGSFNAGWAFPRFTPSNISIQTGDTIRWMFQGIDAHTVTFTGDTQTGLFQSSQGNNFAFSPLMAPTPSNFSGTLSALPSLTSPLSSGVLFNGSSFSVTFNISSGNRIFYYCVLHPFMTGFIDIVTTSLLSPSQVHSQAISAQNRTFNNMPRIEVSKAISDTTPPSRLGANNTKIWTIRMVGESNPLIQASLLRFLPTNVTINLGDSLEFVNDDIMDHIVAFNGTENLFQAFATPVALNPIYINASGGIDFRGGFATSGLLQPAVLAPNLEGLPQPQPNNWTITFNTIGTFPYECPIHVSLGMVGTVTVRSANSTATSP